MANPNDENPYVPIEHDGISFTALGRVTPKDNVYRSGITVKLYSNYSGTDVIGETTTNGNGNYAIEVSNFSVYGGSPSDIFFRVEVCDNVSTLESVTGGHKYILPKSRVNSLSIDFVDGKWLMVEDTNIQTSDDFDSMLNNNGLNSILYYYDTHSTYSDEIEENNDFEYSDGVYTKELIFKNNITPNSFVIDYIITDTWVFPRLVCTRNETSFTIVPLYLH